jgi:uncharacterized protein Veg
MTKLQGGNERATRRRNQGVFKKIYTGLFTQEYEPDMQNMQPKLHFTGTIVLITLHILHILYL